MTDPMVHDPDWDDEDAPNAVPIPPENLLTFPKVSLVLVARADAQLLAQVVDAVLAQDYPAFELIVVDVAHDDAVTALVADYCAREEATVLTDAMDAEAARAALKIHGLKVAPELGLARAHNEALRFADGDFVALLDPFECLAPDALSQWVAAAKRHPAASTFLMGEIDASGDTETQLTAIEASSMWVEGEVLASFNTILLRRRQIETQGGFKASLRAYAASHFLFRAMSGAPVVICRQSSRITRVSYVGDSARPLAGDALDQVSALVTARFLCAMRHDLLWRHALPEVRAALRERADQARGDYLFAAIKRISLVDIGRALAYYLPGL